MRKSSLFGAGILAATILSVLVWVALRQKQLEPALNTVAKGSSSSLLDQVHTLEAREAEWNRTYWAKEVEAQQFEEPVIRWWDDLRNSDNPWSLASRFTFQNLTFGNATSPERLEHDILRTTFGRARQALSFGGWTNAVARWEAEGWRLEQSEWRQVRFEPGAEPVSHFRFHLHLQNTRQPARVILRGLLRVFWKGGTQSAPSPEVLRLEADDLELLRREGDPLFQIAMRQSYRPDPGSVFIDPLIVYDLNHDGLPEIILGCKKVVLWNQGSGRLLARAICSSPPRLPYVALIAEVTGDKKEDLVFGDLQGITVYPGDGRGVFEQGAIFSPLPAGSLFNPFVLTAGDMDQDGDADLYLGQYKLPYVAGQMPTPYYDANDGFAAFLLRNNGSGTFQDATAGSGLEKKRFRRIYSASFAHLDGDENADLVVVSDFAGIDVFRGEGSGKFRDVTEDWLSQRHLFGMSHLMNDFNLDGNPDLLVIGMHSATAQRLSHLGLGPPQFSEYQKKRPLMGYGNRLYFGGENKYRENEMSVQVAETGWSWGTAALDLENDGDPDLYIVNGHKSRQTAREYCPQFWCHDIYHGTSQHRPDLDAFFQAVARRRYGAGESYGGYEKNRLYLNQAGKSFLEIGYLMGVSLESDGRNLVAADLDLDGRMDLITTTHQGWPVQKQELLVLRNRTPSVGNWSALELNASTLGFGPGARISSPSLKRAAQQWITGSSYRSQEPNIFYFGLGNRQEPLEVVIESGGKKTTRILPINKITIEKSE